MTDTTRLDHVVLWVGDPLAAAEFYERSVGLTPLRVAEFADKEVAFPSVRLNEETIFDLAPREMAPRMNVVPGADAAAGHPVNHVCIALGAEEFDALHARLSDHGVPLSDLGHGAFGACGAARRSFYFRDPDGNIFEARHYD
ncbi:VOC family protein [Streptomyces sp. NBC_01304]|uniref:VOC family protein n=1 Tax=Streptomyces sp. NBC_01304 TaxID=2903818 RepID=UPI002E1236C8|nr:VOC family protein [Streptomyces sp. NBC_01304]